jgi:imidazoleglycerol-phosphate dehydratase
MWRSPWVRPSQKRSAIRQGFVVLRAEGYPLDESLVDIALDLSGRPHVEWHVELPEALALGSPAFDPQLAEHAVASFATAAAMTLHVELVRGRNVHHIIEATFKGLARSLRDAVRVDSAGGVPSTKGVL